MSPELQRELASKGGRAAQDKGTGHQWTKREARTHGREAARRRRRQEAA